jgi:hypothetical protein
MDKNYEEHGSSEVMADYRTIVTLTAYTILAVGATKPSEHTSIFNIGYWPGRIGFG